MNKLTHQHLKELGFIDAGYEKEGRIYVCKSDCDTGYVFMTVNDGDIVDCASMIYTYEWADTLIEASKMKDGGKMKLKNGVQMYALERKGAFIFYSKFTAFLKQEHSDVNSLSMARITALSTAKKKLIQKKKMG